MNLNCFSSLPWLHYQYPDATSFCMKTPLCEFLDTLYDPLMNILKQNLRDTYEMSQEVKYHYKLLHSDSS